MNEPELNDPASYYASTDQPSLVWEWTVCESLAAADSPYQVALREPRAYGETLARFLQRRSGLDPGWSVVEVGGGYGSLMASFLGAVPVRNVTMVDVSPHFLERQRRALARHCRCRFVRADAFAFLDGLGALGAELDLVISNENVGDFPTVTGIRRDELGKLVTARGDSEGSGLLARVARAFRRYGFDLDDAPPEFAFNVGAVEYLERLHPRARAVFLCEHGADTELPPEYDFLPLEPGDGYPRRVRLQGHDEYTIRFAHLARVAEALGYGVERFHLAELLGVRTDPGIRAMARTRTTASEAAEVVHEFCEHVAEYQCLLLTR